MKSFTSQEPELGFTSTASTLSDALKSVRGPILAPVLRAALALCTVMSLMLFIERVYMAVIILYVKLFRRKRYTKYRLDAMKEDLELNKSYPMVLIQIPMYNEKEVYLTLL